MVRGDPVEVAVKRRLRERGFDAGQAFGERLFGSGSGRLSRAAEGLITAADRAFAGLPTRCARP